MTRLLALTFVLLLNMQGSQMEAQQMEAAKREEKGGHPIVLRVVYDNNPGDDRLTTGWGFGCVVEGLPKTILFDTGGNGDILLGNMNKLDIMPDDIDLVVLSHIHGDHVGGLGEFLKQNSDVSIFLPAAFPERFKMDVRATGAEVVETSKPQRICPGAFTTGVLGIGIKEQGIYVETADGIVVITGCAHPGIVNITRAAKGNADKPVSAVLGGFHMGGASEKKVSDVIRDLRELGVNKVGPCHCSGDRTRRMMKEAFGDNYMKLCVGGRITFAKPVAGNEQNQLLAQ